MSDRHPESIEADFAPEDLPDEPPPDLDIEIPAVLEPETDLETYITDGRYVVYRQGK